MKNQKAFEERLSLMKASMKMPNPRIFMPWSVYIVQCNDTKLYTGITNNLERRIKAHNSGNGGRFTKYRAPVKLLYSEDGFTRSEALKREAAIKRLPRFEKLKLISGTNLPLSIP